MRRIWLIAVAVAALAANAELPERSFRMIVDRTPIAEYGNYRVVGEVQITSASPLLGGLHAVACADNPNYRGMLMAAPASVRLREGDIVEIEGRVEDRGGTPVLCAAKAVKKGRSALPPAPLHKFVDFRHGKLQARRAAFIGQLDPDSVEISQDGSYTRFHLVIWTSFLVVRVPGRLRASKYEGAPVQVTGIGLNHYDPATGEIREITLEVSSLDDVVSLRENKWQTPVVAAACAVAGIALVVLFFVWAKAHRERIAAVAVANDRRRVAAELHDTIEQHLATAKLYATIALRSGGLSAKAEKAVRSIADTLVHAKVEVRDAVMDLRGERPESSTLAQTLADMSRRISAGGAVRVRTRLDALPGNLPKAVQRDAAAIVNEAVTNAIKHGQAKNIALVCDAAGQGGFVLRILNDGTPFDPSNALGPEAGHFGLAVMKERAVRNSLELEFIRDGRWCGIAISSRAR